MNNDNNNDSNVTSIYIPRVHRKWTKPQIIQIIATQLQCIPFDLDFVTIDKMTPNDKDHRIPFQATFIPSNDSFLSAFVHINQSRHLNQLFFNKDSNFHVKIHPDPSSKEFWMIFRNSKPIPRTHLNIHQITDMNYILSNIVLDLQNQISLMQTQITQMQTQIQTKCDSLDSLEQNTDSQNTDKIDWEALSMNTNAIHLLEQSSHKIDWEALSLKPNAIHFLEQKQILEQTNSTNSKSTDTPTYFRPQSPDYPPPFFQQTTNAPPPTPTKTKLCDFIPLK
jgi:hypothetical protein